jgi:hypothetical protein
MRIDASGNVGIGESDPSGYWSQAYNLVLTGANTGLTIKSTTTGNGRIVFTDTKSATAGLSDGGMIRYDHTSDSMMLHANGSERMRIDSSGNVGIGGTPTHKLYVRNDVLATTDLDPTSIKLYNNGDGGAAIEFSNGVVGNSKISFGVEGTGGGTDDTYIGFSTNANAATATERMRISSSGNVGIGTSSPSQVLDVSSGGGLTRAVIQNTNNAAAGAGVQFRVTSSGTQVSNTTLRVDNVGNFSVFNGTTSETERMHITSGGDVGIGTTPASGMRLHVSGGNIRCIDTYNNTTASAANMVVSSGGTFERSTSSLKYKKEVRDYDKGLDFIEALRPVYYKGKSESDGDKQFAGLIAEEVHDSGLEEFVQYAEDGSPDALAYTHMVALLVNGIKELKAEIETLKSQING